MGATIKMISIACLISLTTAAGQATALNLALVTFYVAICAFIGWTIWPLIDIGRLSLQRMLLLTAGVALLMLSLIWLAKY